MQKNDQDGSICDDRSETIRFHLNRLLTNCNNKRKHLKLLSLRNKKYKKYASTIGGILSILSALTLTYIVVEKFSSESLQVISILLAFTGGLVSIIANAFILNFEGIYDMQRGASEFQGLREEVDRMHFRAKMEGDIDDPNQLKKYKTEFNSLSRSYSSLTSKYDKYIPIKKGKSIKNESLEIPDYSITSQTNF